MKRLLDYHLMDGEDRIMEILCLNDVYRDIREDFAPEEQQESYDLCKEICDDLLNKGILTSGKNKGDFTN